MAICRSNAPPKETSSLWRQKEEAADGEAANWFSCLNNGPASDGTGQVFGSSTGFNLPNGATRSPDVAWVRNERLDALTDEQWHKFLPLCPDFVLELRSPSDLMRALHKKMEEYRENGAQLGWLLDPASKQVHIYRPGAAVGIVNDPATLSGEPLLRGFVLDVPQIWAVMERKR